MLKRLVPKIFYDRMSDGLDLFVDGLGFEVRYQDNAIAVVGRDDALAYIVESPEYAAKDRPEIAIETDTIDLHFEEIASRRPDLLHPNNNRVSQKPWGAKEFALLDKTKVCIVFRQWS